MARDFFRRSNWKTSNILTDYDDEKILAIFLKEIASKWNQRSYYNSETNNCANFVSDFIKAIAKKQKPIDWPEELHAVTEYNRLAAIERFDTRMREWLL